MTSEQPVSGELLATESLVILNFGGGTCQTGFPNVSALIGQGVGAVTAQAMGALPGIESLVKQYQQWQKLYRLLYGYSLDWRNVATLPDFELEEDDITNVSSAEFHHLSEALKQQFNRWLDADGFRQIDRQLRMLLSPGEHVRIMIAAQDHQLLYLPWCHWSLLEDYPKAEIALSPANYAPSVKVELPKQPGVNILGVFGDAADLDLSTERKLLEALPGVEVTFLTKPRWKALNEYLWADRWDILFFAGHSSSQDQGYIQLNEDESIQISQLKFALKNAIEAGLQLVILNSCDGLGLAWELAELKIPQVIAMREPVADQVAQEFLKHFLRAFSKHQTLYLSVREAREKLQPLEARYGCASWLPVIVQNPAEQPPTWRSLTQGEVPVSAKGIGQAVADSPAASQSVAAIGASTTDVDALSGEVIPVVSASGAGVSADALQALSQSDADIAIADLPVTKASPGGRIIEQQPAQRRGWGSTMATAVVVSAVLFGLRWFGGLMPLELFAFDKSMQWRPNEEQDSRLLLITIDEEDIAFQGSQGRDLSLTDDALNQLLDELSEAKVIGLDIYRDFAVQDSSSSLVERLQAPNLIGVCKVPDPTVKAPGIAPPPEIQANNLGFSDLVTDGDGVLRRQMISMGPLVDAACQTPYAFATQVAFNYFAQQGKSIDFNAAGELVIGDKAFPKLLPHTGGYQNIDASGYQILINYRAVNGKEAIAETVPLRQVLQGNLSPELLRDRIVLVGRIDGQTKKDFWATPYGSSTFQEISGVEVHAHIVSQMLAAVENNRPLIWTLSPVMEGLWILAWASLGGVVVLVCRGDLKSVLAGAGAALVVVAVVSFILLLRGGWMPLVPAAIALPVTAMTALTLRQSSGKSRHYGMLR